MAFIMPIATIAMVFPELTQFAFFELSKTERFWTGALEVSRN